MAIIFPLETGPGMAGPGSPVGFLLLSLRVPSGPFSSPYVSRTLLVRWQYGRQSSREPRQAGGRTAGIHGAQVAHPRELGQVERWLSDPASRDHDPDQEEGSRSR